MFDALLLKPLNECPYTGLEAPFPSHPYLWSFRDHNGLIRLVKPFEGAILLQPIGNFYEIVAVYVTPSCRLQGIAKTLLDVARWVLHDVRHSVNLTKEGAAWAASVK